MQFKDPWNFMLEASWGHKTHGYRLRRIREDSATVTLALGEEFFEKYSTTALNVLCPRCQGAFGRSRILNGPNPLPMRWKHVADEMEELLEKRPENVAIRSIWEKSHGIYKEEEKKPDNCTAPKDLGTLAMEKSLPEETQIQVEDWPLHPNKTSSSNSIAGRCHVCTQINLEIQGTNMKPWNGDDSNEEIWLRISKVPKKNAEIFLYRGPHSPERGISVRGGIFLRFRSVLGEFEKFEDKEPHLAYSCLNTSSLSHFAMAKGWLDECCKKHLTCRIDDCITPPSRLIRVGAAEEDIKLCFTKESAPGPRYCTLSHCWGNVTDILTLTTTTLEKLKDGVPLEDLPKTFRDAVVVTRNLEIEYIWIDSLCIIQDDRDDWIKESAIMGDIYQGAVCTISASGASNPHQGLFVNRDPLRYLPCRIVDNKQGRIYLDHPTMAQSFVDEITRDSPLHQRGWVFQERLLSSRILYFGTRGVFWSCTQGQATELNPQGWGWHRSSSHPEGGIIVEIFDLDEESIKVKCQISETRQGHLELKGILEMAKTCEPEEFDHILHLRWADMVHDYSTLSLTRSEDKLVALSGIAQKIQKCTGYQYCAGLWRSNLEASLLWYVIRSQSKRPPYRAPSWSWASVDGHIGDMTDSMISITAQAGEEVTDTYQILANIIDVGTIAHELDKEKTGQILDGFVEISAPIRKAEMIRSTEPEGVNSGRFSILTFDEEKIGIFIPDIAFDEPPSNIFLAPTMHVYGRGADGQSRYFRNTLYTMVISGLALVQKGLKYERVGAFVYQTDVEDSSAVQWYNEAEHENITIV